MERAFASLPVRRAGPGDRRSGRSRRLGSRGEARRPGRVPVHPRRLSLDVPRPALDDAPVRRLRHARRDQRPLPLPDRARADRPVGRLRHADADGPGLRRPAKRGRGRALRCRHGLPRRLRDAVRQDPARRRHDLDDDQRPRGRRVRVLPRDGRGARSRLDDARRHPPDRHLQGVHRAEGVGLPAATAPAADRRPDGVLRRARPQVASDQRLRLPHPRSGVDRGRGARVHAGRRVRLRRARHAAGARRRRVRARAVLLLQRAHRLLRGDREAPRRATDLGSLDARPLRSEELPRRCGCASTRRPPASRSRRSSR